MGAVFEMPFAEAVTVAVWLEAIVPAVAVKVAEVTPDATVTEVGTVSELELEVSETIAPDDADTVTVHVVEACEVSDPAAQVRAVGTTAGATREMLSVFEVPFAEAVTVAVWLEATVPAVAVKVAEVDPEATVTQAGIVRDVELEDSETVAPDEAERVTVHVVEACEASDPAVQVRAVGTTAGATREMLSVFEVPFAEAVTVAVWLEAIVPAVAVKVAEVDPEATVTEAGTVRDVELEDNETVVPDEAERVTVHVVEACEASDPAVQVRAVGITGATREMLAV
jgi:S-ribosylhomocysteine lyase LuxS involved in autoinducer biosynthesis